MPSEGLGLSTDRGRGDIAVCGRDGKPLVWTFEFPGAEYVCVECGATYGCFGPSRAKATPELLREHSELTERYSRESAERRGIPYVAPEVAQADGDGPTCKGCGVTPEPGTPLPDGKPASWYSRTIDGVTEYACSRACIKEGMVLPW